MPNKPKRTLQELLADQQKNPDRGKVNGEYVCTIASREVDFVVPSELFDKINQRRAILGMTKAQFTLQAIIVGLNFFKNINNIHVSLNIAASADFTFSTSVPESLYLNWLNHVQSLGMTKNQAIQFCFRLLIETVEPEYSLFLRNKQIETNLSIGEIQAILTTPNTESGINGICDLGQTELNVLLPGDLYNQIIQMRGAFGLQKAQIAQLSVFGAVQFLSQLQGQDIEISCGQNESKTNFRGNVPTALYRRFFELGQELGITAKNDLAAIAFRLFCDSDYNQHYYRQFISRRCQELQAQEDQVVGAIYGYSKLISRNEAIRLLQQNDPSAYESKMNI